MKKFIFLLFFLIAARVSPAQNLYFPPLTGNTWDTLSPASLGWCDQYLDTLDNYLQLNNTKAFLLLKDGKMVHEQYFGTFTRDSIWYWASAGKTLTSFAVGMAQQEGFLNITDTTSDYIGTGWTNCTPQQEEKITIRHQLTMTSGLDDGVADNHCTLDTCMVYLADAGTRWAYHNAPYTMLDTVLEAATGINLNSFLTTRIKSPTGMDGIFLKVDYDNVYFSRPRSMARFGLMMLNHGNWNGTQIMTDTTYFHNMINTSQQLNKSYGYLWWLNGKPSFMVPGFQFVIPGSLNPNGPSDLIMALGKNGQMLNIVPSQQLIYVRMGDAPGAGDVPITFNDSIWSILNHLMCSSSGVQDGAQLQIVKVHPNPAVESCIVSGLPAACDVMLMDITGKPAWQESSVSDRTEIYLEPLPSGIYFLRIQTMSGESITRKLTVVH